ncbi:unnamed protein product [Clavelina lepadiformis]|uniref:Uncharacterized protein n=1 Tax=Clavelina lepadiformis TaxID=159417 RepID=A0ABP0GGA6_CLALP
MSLETRIILLTCAVNLLQIYSVAGHSWLTCTDYTEKNGATWDPSKCRGFPRDAARFAPKTGTFGFDTGYDHLPGDSNACRGRRTSSSYTSDHPMAVYYPGQQVVLVHPMKNHGADVACGSKWIPDSGSWIYRSGVNPSTDLTLTQFRRNLVFDLGRSPSGKDFGNDDSLSSVYPKSGFQNAPNFCQGTDKAMATYSFNVPKNLRPGLYTFIWMWAFNSANNVYSTCFEVEIVPNKAARDASIRAGGITDFSEPCGGITSNPNVMGNSNPGCSSDGGPSSYAAIPGQAPTTTTTQSATTTTQLRTDSYDYTTPYPDYPDYITPYPDYSTGYPDYSTPYPDYSFYSSTESPDNGYNGGNGNGNSKQTTSTTPATTTTTSFFNRLIGPSTARPSPAEPNNVRLSIKVHMKSTQFAGELWLPFAQDGTLRRYITVDFTCDVELASFWNCRTLPNEDARRKNHFEVVQSGTLELDTNRIFYHVSFTEPCDLSNHAPVARLIREEIKAT